MLIGIMDKNTSETVYSFSAKTLRNHKNYPDLNNYIAYEIQDGTKKQAYSWNGTQVILDLNYQEPVDIAAVIHSKVLKAKLLGLEVIQKMSERNLAEGITTEQSSHVINRSDAILKALLVGAIDTAYTICIAETPDDMTETYHWLTQARLDAVKDDIVEALGELV